MPPAWDGEGPAPDDDAPAAGPSAWPARCGSPRCAAATCVDVVQIEEANYPRPWSSTLFLSELAQRRSRRYTVATIGPLVVGYSGLMVVDEDGHITTLTVDPAWHRRGIGTVLLLDQARAAPALGVRHLTLEVRVSQRLGPGAVPALRLRARRACAGTTTPRRARTPSSCGPATSTPPTTPQRLAGIDARLRSARRDAAPA